MELSYERHVSINNTTADCLPLYTTFNIPEHLNPHWLRVKNMGDDQFNEYSEKLRNFLLHLYEHDNIPLGGNNASLEKIISNLKGLLRLDVSDKKVFYQENGKKILKGYSNFGNSVNHWFPEMRDVEITNGINSIQTSIVGILRDRDLWKRKLTRMVKYDKLKVYRKKPSQRVFPQLNGGMKILSGTQPVVNIRCPVAKWIYQTSMLKSNSTDEIIVYDPSMGWGGRLISLLSSASHPRLRNKKIVYIGTDPNKEIFDRYEMIEKFWKTYVDTDCNVEVIPICCGSEDFHKTEVFSKYKGKGSIVFSSPPYFNRERYSDDESQSFIKYPTYDEWSNGFLKDTIKNVADFLRPRGLFFWNISNIRITKKRSLPLQDDSNRISKDLGLKYRETLHMLMRNLPGRDSAELMKKMVQEKVMNLIRVDGHYRKYEPIFVYEK